MFGKYHERKKDVSENSYRKHSVVAFDVREVFLKISHN
jgi:hypothetical protein